MTLDSVLTVSKKTYSHDKQIISNNHTKVLLGSLSFSTNLILLSIDHFMYIRLTGLGNGNLNEKN